MPGSADEGTADRKNARSQRVAKGLGAGLLLLASRLWSGVVGGWRELGRRDAAVTAVVVLLLVAVPLLLRYCRDAEPVVEQPAATQVPVAGQPAATGGAGTPACHGLLEHSAWTGRISYRHKRDVASVGGDDRVSYAYDVDLGADLTEDTRRQHNGADYLVRVFNPEPTGKVEAEQLLEHFDRLGLAYRNTFVADGGLQRFEEGMSEDGSMMNLVVKADCSYEFYLQGQVMGQSAIDTRSKDTRSGDGLLWLPSVSGSGVADSGSRLSGSADFKVMSSRHLDETRNQRDRGNTISERDKVEDILGRDNLGTARVTWQFEAVD